MATTPYCFPYPSAATYPPHFSGGYYPPPFSSYPATASGFFPAPAYDAPPAFPCAATECTAATGFPYAATYPHSPYLWSPPPTPCSPLFPFGSSPDPAYGNGFIATQASQTAYGPNQPPLAPTLESSTNSPLKPLPVPASSEFSGDLSSRSPLCSRPMPQQQKEEGGQTEDGATPRYDRTFRGKAVHFAMPKFRCRDGDLSKGTNTSGASINDEKLVYTQSGPEILSMANNDSNNSFVTPQGQFQSSFDSLHGELSKLSALVSQFAVKMGLQTTKVLVPGSPLLESTASAPLLSNTKDSSPLTTATTSRTNSARLFPVCSMHPSTGTATVAPQVFGEMPTPRSSQGTHGSATDYRSGHQTPIQCTCVPDGNNNLSEQNLDGMPQAYGLHNLNRQSVFRSDGTEHSYYALPENYPLERTTHEPVFDAYDDETNGCSTEFVDVFVGIPELQKYEDQQESEQLPKCFSMPIFSPERPTVGIDIDQLLKGTCKASKCRTWDEESQGDDNFLWEKSVCRTATGHYISFFPWDPGASAFLVTPLNNDNNNDTIGVFNEAVLDIPPAKPPERYGSADSSHNELIFLCVKKASDDTFSEETTEFTFSHGPAVYGDRFIKLKNEKSTQATSTLCVHEVIVHCHDERLEHIYCTKGLSWELVDPPSHSINHAKLRLLWDPGTSASFHSSKVILVDLLLYYSQGHGAENKQTVHWDPGIGISSSMSSADILNYTFKQQQQNDKKASANVQQLRDPQLNALVIHVRRKEWDPGASLPLMLDLAAWQNQSGGSGTCYIWDPGTVMGYTFLWLVLATVRDTLYAKHYCQTIQKNYNASNLLSSQSYLHI